MKAAILTRFSSDQQRETSLEDQERNGRAYAERSGLSVVGVYSDRSVSGATPVTGRPGGGRMLRDAEAGGFEVLLIEGLDRLARDLLHQERVVRELEHRGIRIIGWSDGYDSASESAALDRGIRGLMNQQYLITLANATRRGLDGQVSRGLHAGGLPYGYRSVPVEGGHRLEIDQERARWVRWIFERYAAGASHREIVHELNERGVPSPRGGTWAVSAVFGSPAKGTGILNQELYRGIYIWNRSTWTKDPETGVRKRRERPPHEWRRREVPELRIVPDDLWKAVKARQGGGSKRGRPAATLLGGILRCGHCGGPVIAVSARLYGCGWRKDRGPAVCSGVNVRRDVLESVLLKYLRQEALTPENVRDLAGRVRKVIRQRAEARAGDAPRHRERLVKVEREIERLTDAVAEMGLSDALRGRLAKAEAERAELVAALEEAPEGPLPDIIPQVADRARSALERMPELMRQRPKEARKILEDVLAGARVVEEDGAVYAEVEDPPLGLLLAAGGESLNVVAGARFGHWRRLRIR